MEGFRDFCKMDNGILTASKKEKPKELSFESFKERYLSYEEDKFLRVGDKISIPFLKDRDTKYTPIQFVVIDKDISVGKHYKRYIDLMSIDYRIPVIRWAMNSTVKNTDIEDPIDVPYYDNEKKISSLIYRYLQEQVRRFPEEIQNAMVEKTVQPYITLKQGDKHFLQTTESIGRIWPLSADEVYGKRVTKIHEDSSFYGLDQMPFFQEHPDFFDKENDQIVLRKTIYPHTISYITVGYLQVTKRIETEFTTPICMRLQIHE